MKEALSTVYLRLDSSSRSLTKTALSQVVLKIAYSLNREFTRREISRAIKECLNTTINDEKLDDALNLLCQENVLKKDAKKFYIGTKSRTTLEDAYKKHIARLNTVLEIYFYHAQSEKENIKKWFQEVTVLFFETHASKWVDELCRGGGKKRIHHFKPGDIATKDLFKKNSILQEDEEWLRSQYCAFLNSDETNDAELKWDFGTSAFSSRLLVASSGIDKLTIDMFRECSLVLDTNVLMYLGLEESDLAKPLEALEQVIKDLKIKPGYFNITRREYERAIIGKRKDLLAVFEHYSRDLLSKAIDPFVQTVFARGCINADDIDRFFSTILHVPSFFSKDLPIDEFDSVELANAITIGESHDATIGGLNKIFERRFGKPKREIALKHDAGIIAGVQEMRKTGKCWLITKDGTIEEFASQNSIRDDCPIAIGIYTLVNILAIDNGGASVDPIEFAPLFSSIIKLSLVPEKGSFQLEDLARILEVESQIASLSDSAVAGIAQRLNHSRLTGKDDERISLQLAREFQREKLTIQSDLDSTKQDLHFERQDKQKVTAKAVKLGAFYRSKRIGELQKEYDKQLLLNKLGFVLLPFVGCCVIFALSAPHFFPDSSRLLVTALATLSSSLFWFCINRWVADPRLMSRYNERVLNIVRTVDDEIRELQESS